MTSWGASLADLRPATVRGEIAPHKPVLVLVLLARAQEGKPNRLPFREFEPEFHRILDAIGWASKRRDAELPFWHLQSSGFWFIPGADSIPKRKGHIRPSAASLRECDAVGVVDETRWRELKANPVLARRLARAVLQQYLAKHEPVSIARTIGVALE
jgi:predicted restriction endonuclease